ncbi:MAG: Sugar transferases involved in lipopolysaccharide synthesis [Bacteroidetes bacterium HLUCCA01]|nr:MAG: Sugar transferases involved in lipopolysaccharide synthesis [Bacteroidetes bacterium HLUCCA01]
MLKRVFDFLVSIIGLVLIFPLFLLLILLVRINMGSPVFFTQVRPGKDGKLFKIYKFRSMTNEKDEEGCLLPNEQRLTRFGNFLRSTSFDELPGLFNVIKGEMSLVGPRPLRIEYLPLYNDFQKRRHEVRPGITGWAQINGRNNVSWEEKFKMDVWYVNNQGFWLDLVILFLTFYKVFKRDGINQNEEKTMEPFKGVKLDG